MHCVSFIINKQILLTISMEAKKELMIVIIY